MLAMQKSYEGLKKGGSDLKYCEGKTIKDFFDQVGLADDFDFDNRIEEFSKKEVEHTSQQDES